MKYKHTPPLGWSFASGQSDLNGLENPSIETSLVGTESFSHVSLRPSTSNFSTLWRASICLILSPFLARSEFTFQCAKLIFPFMFLLALGGPGFRSTDPDRIRRNLKEYIYTKPIKRGFKFHSIFLQIFEILDGQGESIITFINLATNKSRMRMIRNNTINRSKIVFVL